MLFPYFDDLKLKTCQKTNVKGTVLCGSIPYFPTLKNQTTEVVQGRAYCDNWTMDLCTPFLSASPTTALARRLGLSRVASSKSGATSPVLLLLIFTTKHRPLETLLMVEWRCYHFDFLEWAGG
jgi:hypothetical protein